MRYAISLALLLYWLGACSDEQAKPESGAEGQSFAEAMILLCDAEQRSGAADRPPAEHIQVLTEWINRSIDNPEVRDLVSGLVSAEDPDTIRQRLDQAVARAGLTECALLATFGLT